MKKSWGLMLAAFVLYGALTGCDIDKHDTLVPATTGEAAATAKSSVQRPVLSQADREQAKKQGKCPISGNPLGSMGEPYKVTYKDRSIFLCCDGCKEEFDKDPEKYIKIVDKMMK